MSPENLETHHNISEWAINAIEYDYEGPNGCQRKLVYTDRMLYIYHQADNRWQIVENFPCFTPEELAQLTLVNLVAFDTAWVKATAEQRTIPCWLCSDEEHREKARQEVLALVRESLTPNSVPFTPVFTIEMLAEHLEAGKATFLPMLKKWKAAEAHRKYHREVHHNPRAFFVEPAWQKHTQEARDADCPSEGMD